MAQAPKDVQPRVAGFLIVNHNDSWLVGWWKMQIPDPSAAPFISMWRMQLMTSVALVSAKLVFDHSGLNGLALVFPIPLFQHLVPVLTVLKR
jgi:hypothetical protein